MGVFAPEVSIESHIDHSLSVHIQHNYCNYPPDH